jgi:hypothetical protein
LNMLTVQYAQQYEAEGFTFLAVTPGVSLGHQEHRRPWRWNC